MAIRLIAMTRELRTGARITMKRTRKYLCAIASGMALMLPAVVWSQSQPPVRSATQPSNAERASNGELSPGDRQFLEDSAIGGMQEVELGKVALQKAPSESVRAFAQRMVDDHNQTREQLQSIAEAKGLSLPTGFDARHQKEIDRLQKLSGSDFERAYMKLVLDAHQKDIREFRKQAEQGADSDIRSFVMSALPKLHDHLALARDAARTAKVIERGKPTATNAAASKLRDTTTGAATDDPAGEAQSDRSRDSGTAVKKGQARE
jgi:putative membrane protein